MDKITVDLTLPPQERWPTKATDNAAIYELTNYYLGMIGIDDTHLALLSLQLPIDIPLEYQQEIEGIAVKTAVPTARTLALNLYYDLSKFIMGCTAFAVETKDGILHARNAIYELTNYYLGMIGIDDTHLALLSLQLPIDIPSEYQQEIEGIAVNGTSTIYPIKD